jgi:hypothetical protein
MGFGCKTTYLPATYPLFFATGPGKQMLPGNQFGQTAMQKSPAVVVYNAFNTKRGQQSNFLIHKLCIEIRFWSQQSIECKQ